MPQYGWKDSLLRYFCARILKEYCHSLNQQLQICLIAKFCEQKKLFKLETKNALFWYCRARNLKTYYPIWNKHPPNFSNCKNLQKKHAKMAPFQTNNALFCCSLTIPLKNYCHIWNPKPSFLPYSKFCKETKVPNFGSKIACSGSFWARTSKNYYHIWNQHPQISQLPKFGRKEKLLRFVTKNALFGYLFARISKQYYHIWNQNAIIY